MAKPSVLRRDLRSLPKLALNRQLTSTLFFAHFLSLWQSVFSILCKSHFRFPELTFLIVIVI